MIGQHLMGAIRAARLAALKQPALFPAALDAVAEQVDRLLELTGEPAAPLRQAGQRMAVTIYRALAFPAERMQALARLTEEAVIVARLERVIPCRDTPPHWLPQVAAGAARNTPFMVIPGGRA